MIRFAPCALAGALFLAGCASTLSGVGGADGYACKAPEGVSCTSVSGVYVNSVQNNLPSQRAQIRVPDARAPQAAATYTRLPSPPSEPGNSIRSASRVLRVWIAPWEDSDGDLQDASYVYVVVDTGRWLIEHKRAAIRNSFAPIAPPRQAPPLPAAPEASPVPGSFMQQRGTFPLAPGTPLAPEGQDDVK